jgi:N-methylhydantoinase B
MHLPDIFMFKPIFHDAALQGYAVVIAHHVDVGGRVPGSNASDSTEIYQEGVRIAPLKLYDRGTINHTLITILEKNVRLPELVIGDLEAQYATCNIGEREMLKLIARYGATQLDFYYDELIDYGERLTRSAIATWPNGAYRFEDVIGWRRPVGRSDLDPLPDPCPRRSPRGRFRGLLATSPWRDQLHLVVPSNRRPICRCVAHWVTRCRTMPASYRCITISAPEGSVLNPVMPAPVASRAADRLPGRRYGARRARPDRP